MNGLSAAAQSPLQASPTTSASGPEEKSLSVTVSTGNAESETEGCLTPANTSAQSSDGSKKPMTTYWLQEKPNPQGWMETTVYRHDDLRGRWRGHERPFAEWWPHPKPLPDGLFSAELEEGLTISEAARQLRMKREEAKG